MYESVLRFLDTVEHKNVAQMPSGQASVYWRTAKIEEPEQAHVLTAMGTLSRQFIGGRKEDLVANVEWFVSKGGNPTWEKPDFVYWYISGLCIFQQGGDIWRKWNESNIKALSENQIKEGEDAGSWNHNWGTMLGALSLEVYYCYSRK